MITMISILIMMILIKRWMTRRRSHEQIPGISCKYLSLVSVDKTKREKADPD